MIDRFIPGRQAEKEAANFREEYVAAAFWDVQKSNPLVTPEVVNEFNKLKPGSEVWNLVYSEYFQAIPRDRLEIILEHDLFMYRGTDVTPYSIALENGQAKELVDEYHEGRAIENQFQHAVDEIVV